ncbi:MAG: hypothetical protein OHK0046_15200 [Anaerolineae bacterium]
MSDQRNRQAAAEHIRTISLQVVSLCDALLGAVPLPEEVQEIVQIIRNNGQRYVDVLSEEGVQEILHAHPEHIADLNHELRTPLVSLIGYSDLLLEGLFGDLDADPLEHITTIRTLVEDVDGYLVQLLEVPNL